MRFTTAKATGKLNKQIQIFIILGIAVNCGGNTTGEYIGTKNFYLGDAPFVGGIGGFASVFVTASFAYGGTESIAITAGETKNPSQTLPRVVRNVFWRILIFYILSILIIGLNVPYTYPGLADKDSHTSPFTIVFMQAGSKVAGSFINAVVMTSVISAGNHALFAGSRLMYSLGVNGHAPRFFATVNRNHVPWVGWQLHRSVDCVSEPATSAPGNCGPGCRTSSESPTNCLGSPLASLRYASVLEFGLRVSNIFCLSRTGPIRMVRSCQ